MVELCVLPAGGKVDPNVDGGNDTRDGEEEGEDSRGGSGEDGDVGRDGGVPKCHSASPGTPGREGKVGVEHIFTVEKVAVNVIERLHDGANIAGKGLGFTEEDEERKKGVRREKGERCNRDMYRQCLLSRK